MATATLEHKYYSILHEWKIDAAARLVEGYAATWALDSVNDQIEPGAFAKTIHEDFDTPLKVKGSPDIRFLWEHQSPPIGVVRQMREDEVGLWVQAYLSKTIEGERTLILLDDKAVDRLSIGFIAKLAKSIGGIRRLLEIKLLEFSIVTFPANETAMVTALKNRHFATKGRSFMSLDNKYWAEYFVKVREDATDLGAAVKRGATLSAANRARLGKAMQELTEVMASCAVMQTNDMEMDDAESMGANNRTLPGFAGDIFNNTDRSRPVAQLASGEMAAVGTGASNRQMPGMKPGLDPNDNHKSGEEPPSTKAAKYCSECGGKMTDGKCPKCFKGSCMEEEVEKAGVGYEPDANLISRENPANLQTVPKSMSGFGEGCPSPDGSEDASAFASDVTDIVKNLDALLAKANARTQV